MKEKTRSELPGKRVKPPVTGPLPDRKKPVEGEEIGGRDGPDPTRYGDWEKNGRCIDF